ncbi:rhamnulokinase [Allonocardiopsis opalescens]|uniref:Rhamnulokinase n=1 Tax=Allonocardiopsis opalescens TaxID=1144618 RepID=A0A2T0QCU1_9ACTN|nr:rhamnulokinase family protein [Allonocardiopsis opalescens]PRY01690.1 rhamnulokinase [Allonocardiopsis opalescens]
MSAARYAAVDLGASSGRVVVGAVGPGELSLTEAHRFANRPVRLPTGLHWDVLDLYAGVLDGLRAAAEAAPVSVGVDGWAVDYGLLDSGGALLGNPHHYRDARTEGVAEAVRDRIGARRLYELTGLQFLPFNTVFQLAAERGAALGAADRLLLVPDLVNHWLTGAVGAELTNASTTGLLDVRTRTWSAELAAAVGLPLGLLPEPHAPGHRLGPLTGPAAEHTGLGAAEVVAVASHDTASAVVGVPATTASFGYLSCGTWSLAGLELPAPVLTDAAREANFTNELGLDGTTRFLRNIAGLWPLQESLRTWAAAGTPADLTALLRAAARAEPFAALLDLDDPVFLPPGDMPARIADYCRRTGQRPPPDRPALVRCVLESLALAHRAALRQAADLAGRDLDVVHLVGGGAHNALLCRLTCDALGLPLVAGPVEATALGNVLVQARADDRLGDLAGMRRLIAETQPLRRYEPEGDAGAWTAAERRVAELREAG